MIVGLVVELISGVTSYSSFGNLDFSKHYNSITSNYKLNRAQAIKNPTEHSDAGMDTLRNIKVTISPSLNERRRGRKRKEGTAF